MTSSYLSVWPVLPPAVYLRAPSSRLAFPLEHPNCRLYSRARHGLWHGVRALGLGGGDEVLVPAYHHGSEVEALRRASLGCRFYEVTEGLEPDEVALESLVSPTVRALYLTHYLGLPQDVARWRSWCDERGLLLIEDAAQAWLATVGGRPLGSFGDLSIFCLYKTFGLPDGGAVIAADPPPAPTAAGPVGLGALGRRHAGVFAGPAVRLAERARPRAAYDPAANFALGDPSSPPARASLFLLARAFDPSAPARRRANYAILGDELAAFLSPSFPEPSDGASPFAFPIEVDDKARLMDRLRERGVAALDFWSFAHPSVEGDRFPRTAELRRRVIALPVHQEIAREDVARVAAAVRGRRPPRQELCVDLAGHAELREEWTELAEESGNVFATWEWSSLWWRHFGEGVATLRLAACRSRGGRLVAVLPLYVRPQGPLRIVRFLGHGAGDQLGPVCAPRDRAPAARALRRLLDECDGGWDVLLAEQLIAEEGWSALLGAKVVRTTGFPVLDLDGEASWADFLGGRSANFRSQLRRKERRLAAAHDVRYRLADDPACLERDLDTLFELHARRWRDHDSPFAGSRERFHREFAAVALERGWLRLWFLELDGAPVAAWYGFRYAGRESYYQAGRDTSWEPYSIGFLLLMRTIRAALEEGMREYRFLRGDEAYKYRFATRDPGLEILARGRGLAGGVAVAGGLAAYGIPAVRERLRGALGA